MKAGRLPKNDLFEDGLTGHSNSTELRNRLARKLNLPLRISTNALLQVLNTLYGYEKYKEVVKRFINVKGMELLTTLRCCQQLHPLDHP